jgi:hypothetical protein
MLFGRILQHDDEIPSPELNKAFQRHSFDWQVRKMIRLCVFLLPASHIMQYLISICITFARHAILINGRLRMDKILTLLLTLRTCSTWTTREGRYVQAFVLWRPLLPDPSRLVRLPPLQGPPVGTHPGYVFIVFICPYLLLL